MMGLCGDCSDPLSLLTARHFSVSRGNYQMVGRTSSKEQELP